MSVSKNFYDKAVPSRNLVTTITGVITLLLAVLVGFGLITPDQSVELNTHALAIVNGIVGVWGAITAIILMFKATDA